MLHAGESSAAQGISLWRNSAALPPLYCLCRNSATIAAQVVQQW